MATYRKSKDDGVCSIQFLKYVLFIFNFIFWLSGAAVLGVGIWTIIDRYHYVSLLTSSSYVATVYILIVAGCIVLLTGIIGCISLWREQRCCLLMYTFLLLLIFLMEGVAGIMAYVYQEQVEMDLNKNLNSTFVKNYKIDKERTEAIDMMQQKFKCCGALTFVDWQYSEWKKKEPRTINKVPDSCCRTKGVDCGKSDHPSNIFYNGCSGKFANYLGEHLIILGAVGLGICFVQVFGMIFACCLYLKLKEYHDSYYS